MSLPVPPAFTSGMIPSDWEYRGSRSVSPGTKSSKDNPTGYVSKDVCGDDAYVHAAQSVTIVTLANCVPVTVASLSIKGYFGVGTTAANMQLLADHLTESAFAYAEAQNP